MSAVAIEASSADAPPAKPLAPTATDSAIGPGRAWSAGCAPAAVHSGGDLSTTGVSCRLHLPDGRYDMKIGSPAAATPSLAIEVEGGTIVLELVPGAPDAAVAATATVQ